MSDRRLLMASLDPEAAIMAAREQRPPSPLIVTAPRVAAFTMEVAVAPRTISRWRFVVFLWLLRLAARLVPFKFELSADDEAP